MNKTLNDILKEVYAEGSCPSNARNEKEGTFIHKSEGGYFFQYELEALLDDTKKRDYFRDLVYDKNPFLAMIPKEDAASAAYHIPVIGFDNE